MATELRRLPSVDSVLSDPRVAGLLDGYPREAVRDLVRRVLDRLRERVRSGEPAPHLEGVVEAVLAEADRSWRTRPTPLINATGVVLQTNLGRAPLSAEALEAVRRVAAGYSDLEFDLEAGRRGSRHQHLSDLLAQVTGAEAGVAVNNNAAAVLLGLAAVAAGREVIVSRGEAVEIGGGFRIPDVLRQSGATLVEVGTTNRTYVHDYEAAINERTGAILSVHTSNFRIVGFTHAPDIADLVALGRRRGVPVLHDLGSGCLLDTARFGLAHEPTPQESIGAGVDLAFFSGDKLLGGPQAGIIVGRREMVERVSRHPLARALRVDKMTVAALTATLLHYIRGEAEEKIPVWRMIGAAAENLRGRAESWRRALGSPLASVVPERSAVGGGSLPGETLPTFALALDAGALPGGAHALAERLRIGRPPVVARIEDERVLLDPRSVLPEQDSDLVAALRRALGQQP